MGNRSRKVFLWEQDPHCYWCGRLTQLTNCPNGIIPPDAATVDHLFSRFNPERWMDDNNLRRVLSCYKCNHDRSREEDTYLSKEEKYLRSKGFTLKPSKRPPAKMMEIFARLRQKQVDKPSVCDMVLM